MKINFTISIILLTTLVFTSCKNTVIEGKVLDGFGQPVKEATVKVDGTQFTAQTNRDGEYSVGYVPGDIKVIISKQGYTDTSFSVKISTEAKFPAAAVTIFKIPQSDSLFLMDGTKYSSLSTGNITEDQFNSGDYWSSRTTYIYTVHFDTTKMTTIKKGAGEIKFFDHDPRPLTLLQVQNPFGNGGTLLQRSVNNGGLGFAMGDFGDQGFAPPSRYTNLNAPHCGIRHCTLDVGYYAIVQYQKKSSPAVIGNAYVFRVIK